MNNYCVYKHESPNGKVYIGITCKNPLKRWGKNGAGYFTNIYFYNAILKYGWNNIKHEILFTSLTKTEACQKEIELIAFYKSDKSEFGYNHTSGGENCTFSEESRMRLSQMRKGKKHAPDWGRKHGLSIIGEKNGRSKKVQCIETGEIFSCAKMAAEKYALSNSSILKACKGAYKTSGNMHWRYANATE